MKKTLILIGLLVLLSVSSVSASTSVDSNWAKCKNLNVNGGSTILYDFPFYVNVNYDEDMQTDFEDIRFINASCNNFGSELSYEIDEKKDGISVGFWIKAPNLETGVNQFSMYYGNPLASSSENKADVWSNNYTAVWHLSEGSGISIKDSLGRMNGSFWHGNPTWKSANCAFGNCLYFDGNDDINFIFNPIQETTPQWLEFWGNRTNTNDQMGLCIPTKDNSWIVSPFTDACIYYHSNNGGWRFEWNVNNIYTPTSLPNSYSPGTILEYFGAGYDGDSVYSVGQSKQYKSADTSNGIISYHNTKVIFGSRGIDIGYWIGRADELRISKVIRNPSWASRTIDNANFSLFNFGSEELVYEYSDLAITDLSFTPSNPEIGEQVTVNVNITNFGNTPIPSFNWIYNFDYQESNSPQDGSGLQPGESINLQFTHSYTPFGGNYQFYFEVDPNNAINESNENNNIGILDIFVNGTPDLYPFFVSQRKDINNTKNAMILFNISNLGNIFVENYVYNIDFGDGQGTGGFVSEKLNPLTSSSLTVEHEYTNPGIYQVVLEVDPSNTIFELNETNNIAKTRVAIEGSLIVEYA